MSQTEIDQQNRRAIKAQKARQAAIESLRLKREERKQEVKRIAEQEIVMCYNFQLCPTTILCVCLSVYLSMSVCLLVYVCVCLCVYMCTCVCGTYTCIFVLQ